MLEASPLPIDHFPAVPARIPPDIDVEALAREVKAFRRPQGVRSATDLLRLALAWGPGGYSMQRVAAWAGERKIAALTEDALIQRLHNAGPFLEALTRRLLIRVGGTPCWHGRVPRVSDGTSLSKQASKGTDWRVHGVYDLGRGGFTHLEVTDSHGGEALDRGTPMAGEIRTAIVAMPMPRPGSISSRPATSEPTSSCGCAGTRSTWWTRPANHSTS